MFVLFEKSFSDLKNFSTNLNRFFVQSWKNSVSFSQNPSRLWLFGVWLLWEGTVYKIKKKIHRVLWNLYNEILHIRDLWTKFGVMKNCTVSCTVRKNERAFTVSVRKELKFRSFKILNAFEEFPSMQTASATSTSIGWKSTTTKNGSLVRKPFWLQKHNQRYLFIAHLY